MSRRASRRRTPGTETAPGQLAELEVYGPAVGEVTVNGPTMNGDHQNVKNDTSGFTIDVNPHPGAAAGDSTGPALPPGA
ncbi:hypothetical protein ACFWQ1_18005, partial [Streptomyces albidoflavus]